MYLSKINDKKFFFKRTGQNKWQFKNEPGTALPLTEVDRQELVLPDHLDEEIAVDVLDRVLLHLVQQPRQQLRLFPRVA
jgi:hypothetical protein